MAIKTRVSVVYLETWGEADQMKLEVDIRSALTGFADYTSRRLYKLSKDSAQLLT